MREAIIVSTARTPIGKAYKGAFNDTQAQTLAGHAISEAVKRSRVAKEEIDDLILGAASQQGTQQGNIARQALLRAGLPVSVAGMSLDRQCASGMMAIATAAKEIIDDGMTIAVGGGVESVSLTRNEHFRTDRAQDPWFETYLPTLYMTMIETAENVAQRYGISREAQDEYSYQSQMRTANAQSAGLLDTEIVPLKSLMKIKDKETGSLTTKEVTLEKDEGNRPNTTLEGLSSLKPVFKDGIYLKKGNYITAGNASQLSDGASASVLMEAKEVEKRGLQPLGIYRGISVAGCEPDEMGIGPVFAVPKLLKQHN
jgi:acetyl-CoA C-acetyltransferase